jgi:hypothetical protein
MNPSDFLFIPFTPELTKAGIASTCRSFSGLSIKSNEGIFFILRREVASIAAKLAFHRLIEACNVAHQRVILKPFTNPDEPDISISGRRVECINFLITKTKSIERIIRMPESFLQAPMIVNLPWADLQLFQDEDLLFFSISLGMTTAHLSELQKYSLPDGNKYLFYLLPLPWTNPKPWMCLGRLIMKSEHGPEMTVELGGSNEQRFFFTHTQYLPERVRIEIEREFFTLTYLHVAELPAGRISIYSPYLKRSCTINTHEWGNLWVYGSQIILLGYITWDEFKRKAHVLPAGSLVMGEMRLPMKCRAIDVIDLYPMRDLIPNVKHIVPSD